MVTKINIIALIFFTLTLSLYFISSGELTAFNHFNYLADGFLKGNLFVSANTPWLEQVPIDLNHFYVPYPPLPAILLMPFRLLFSARFPQDYLSYFLGAGATSLMILISQKVKSDIRLAIWVGLLTGFGTITWFMSAVGSSWYLGQISAFFLLTFAIHESLGKKRFFLIGILIGAAYLSRIETIVTIPFFLYMTYKKGGVKNYLLTALGIAPFVLFNFYYNFARFGVIWDKAYTLIPGVTTESWYDKGVLNLTYIPRHIKIIFTQLPQYRNQFPFIKPGLGGLAIWFTTPAFLYALRANIKSGLVQYAWVSIILISLIVFSHGTTGFAQFGYRFAVDFYPFLILLTIIGVSKTGVRWHHWILLTLSVLVNLWGVIFINKLGWVNF